MPRKIEKELKNPDQFLSFWSRVGSTLAQRQRLVLAAGLGFVVLLFAIWGGRELMRSRSAQASGAFARIQRVATADLLPESGSAPAATDGIPRFKTARERIEAALKEADGFLSAHGGSSLADDARLLRAQYLLSLGKADEAATLYQQLASGDIDANLKFLALEGLAYSHEAAGQNDKAIASFGLLADEAQKANGFYRDRALFNKARLLANKGSAKEAEKLYREVLEKTPTTPLRDEINDRLAALGSVEGK